VRFDGYVRAAGLVQTPRSGNARTASADDGNVGIHP
jgi:hypothetical protein